MKTFAVAVIVVSLAAAAPLGAAKRPLHLIPTPKHVKVSGGELEVKPTAKIIAAAEELKPLAEVLQGDLLKLTGLRLATAEGTARPGDIVLRLDGSLKSAQAQHWPHTLRVTDRIEMAGGDYNAVAMGTATSCNCSQSAPGAYASNARDQGLFRRRVSRHDARRSPPEQHPAGRPRLHRPLPSCTRSAISNCT